MKKINCALTILFLFLLLMPLNVSATEKTENKVVYNQGNIKNGKYKEPVREGYEFAGWYTDKECTDGNEFNPSTDAGKLKKNTRVYAKWTANSNTKYVVNHYQQNVDNDNYTLKDKDNLTGTTDTSVSPKVKSYEGFNKPAQKTVTIKGDGRTVVDYYYNRNTYTVTLNKGTGIESVSGAGTYKYGANITISAVVSEGYEWVGWTGTYEVSDQEYTFVIKSNVIVTANAQIPPQAFAVYSAEDTSLSFYKRSSVPSVSDGTYEGKAITAVYEGIENMTISTYKDVPWASAYARSITKVSVVDLIQPTTISYWFYNTRNCSDFDLKNLDTAKTTSMKSTFYQAGTSVTSFVLDLTHWDTSEVTTMEKMFYYAGASKTVTKFQLDLSNWNVSKVTSFYDMFNAAGEYASVWTVGDLKTKVITREDGTTYHAWNVSRVENFTSMFSCVGEGADEFTLDVSNWDVSGALYLGRMFSAFRRDKVDAVIELDVATKEVTLEDGTKYTAWDLSNYSGNLYYMFGASGQQAKSLKIDLSSWDISNVTSLKWMFMNAGNGDYMEEFYLGDLSGWNTGNVTDMTSLFQDAGKNADWFLDLSGWDVSKVTARGGFGTGVADKIIYPNFP